MMLRYNVIREMDISNGKGVGCSIFFQGCQRHCYNCFNSETWDFNGGKILTNEDMLRFEELCNRDYIDFVSFLGGEPFDQPLDELLHFVSTLKRHINKPFYIWTGYTLEELQKDCNKEKLLQYFDYIIDGAYIDSLKDYRLYLRGSSNQRIWHRFKQNGINYFEIIS